MNKLKLLMLSLMLMTIGAAKTYAYTTDDLEAAGWTKVTSITNVSDNFYILVHTTESTVVGLPNDNDALAKARYRALENPKEHKEQVWQLEANGDGTYAIQRLSDDSYINVAPNTSQDPYAKVESTKTNCHFVFTHVNNGTWKIRNTDRTETDNFLGGFGDSCGSGSGVYFYGADGAHSFYLYAIAREDYDSKYGLLAVLNAANAITVPTENIGTGAFQFSQTKIDAFTTALSNANTVYNNPSATDEQVTAAKSALEGAMAVYNELNEPTAERYNISYHYDGRAYDGYYVTMYKGVNPDQGNYGAKYFTASSNVNYGQAFTLTASDAGVNYYTLSFTTDDGTTRYLCDGTVYSSGTEDYIARRIRTTDDASKALKVLVQFSKMSGDVPYFNLINTTKGAGIGENNNNDMYTANTAEFSFSEASKASVPVVLDAGKYGTRIFPFVPTKVAGVTYYSCSVGAETLTLDEVTGNLAANTPYILYANSDVDQTLEGWGTAQQDDDYTTGSLTGTYASTGNVSSGKYVLQTQDGVQAFYKVNSNAVSLTPYRAYLTFPEPSARAIYFDGGITGINAVAGESVGIAEIYGIDGTRYEEMRKGMNVVKMSDGRVLKVIVNK